MLRTYVTPAETGLARFISKPPPTNWCIFLCLRILGQSKQALSHRRGIPCDQPWPAAPTLQIWQPFQTETALREKSAEPKGWDDSVICCCPTVPKAHILVVPALPCRRPAAAACKERQHSLFLRDKGWQQTGGRPTSS